MKKAFFFLTTIFLILAVLSGCKKKYHCECTSIATWSLVDEQNSTISQKKTSVTSSQQIKKRVTKKQAQDVCNATKSAISSDLHNLSYVYNSAITTCLVK